jgi:hypothetical protein
MIFMPGLQEPPVATFDTKYAGSGERVRESAYFVVR